MFFTCLNRNPEQCPSVVSLLAESYNPHVRYGAAMALGIACAGTGLKVNKSSLVVMQIFWMDSDQFVDLCRKQWLYWSPWWMTQSTTCAKERCWPLPWSSSSTRNSLLPKSKTFDNFTPKSSAINTKTSWPSLAPFWPKASSTQVAGMSPSRSSPARGTPTWARWSGWWFSLSTGTGSHPAFVSHWHLHPPQLSASIQIWRYVHYNQIFPIYLPIYELFLDA